jgi:branched-chain amino acid transport system substrate-binding protein
MIVAQASYEVTDPTIDSQIVTLKGSGADVFVNITTPKFAAQAIRKVADLGWKPVHYLNNVSQSIASVLQPAGLDKSLGLISTQYLKEVSDPRWASDPGMKEYFEFAKKNLPDLNPQDSFVAYGYTVGQLTVQLLKQCGDNLTRENVMRQAASLNKVQLPLAVPGVMINTSPADYALFQALQLTRFDGKAWVPFGEPVEAK